MAEKQETLLEFPCVFPVKIMGKDQPELHALVKDVIQKYAPDTDASSFRQSASKTGKFVSITVTINAVSKQQIDAIYLACTDSPLTLYVL